MKKKSLSVLLLVGLLSLPAFSRAEDSATAVSADVNVGTKAPIREELMKNQQTVRQTATDARKGIMEKAKETRAGIIENAKSAIKDVRTANPGKPGENGLQIKEIRTEAKMDLKTNRDSTTEALQANRMKKVEALKVNQATFKTELDARKKELEQKMAEKKDERKTKLAEQAKARVKAQLETIFARLNARLTAIEQVDAKIAIRINALVTAGKDTTAVSAQFAIAQSALAKAKTDIEATKNISTDQTDLATSKDTFRALVKTAEDSIQNALAEYRKTINLLMPTLTPRPAGTTSATEVKTTTTTPAQ